jgi:hypothetical protein
MADRAGALPDPLASTLRDHIERVRADIGERSDTGRMYSVRLDRPTR